MHCNLDLINWLAVGQTVYSSTLKLHRTMSPAYMISELDQGDVFILLIFSFQFAINSAVLC